MKGFLLRSWGAVLFLTAAACAGRSPSAPSETTPSMAAPFAVSGIVRDTLPSGGTGFTITGARIEVVGKPGVIATATTDGSGAYQITGVAGQFQVRVIRTGYETTTVTVGPATTDQKVDIGLVPIPVRISGLVTETAPTESRPVAGARVEVTTGSNIGKAVVTDAAGRYTLPGVWGEFTLRITRDGFQEQTQRIVVTGDDLTITITSPN
jgi:Carboxypeptidase regulatory-like domain